MFVYSRIITSHRYGCFMPHSSARGFTLLEMLLVVGIMSALALSATLFVGNQDDQRRFEETNQRLQAIRRAVVGDETMSAGQYVPEGFVAENGVLPGEIDALLAARPSGFIAQASVVPVFDASPDSITGLNDGVDEKSVSTDSTAQLLKGWLAGKLLATPGAGGKFGDAWGPAGDTPNYGWGIDTSIPLNISVTSNGKDRNSGGSEHNADITDTILAQHWSSLLGGLSVSLTNGKGEDLYSSTSYYRVSLLIFENTSTGVKWKRFTSTGVNCLDGDGDGWVDTNGDTSPDQACPSSVTLSFSPNGCEGCTYTSANTRIPYGRHLLVAVLDSNNTPHDNTTDDLYDRDTVTPEIQTIHLPITCRPSGCPHATLILR